MGTVTVTEEQLDKMGFREWTSHYEKEQEADRDKINEIVHSVGTLSGSVNRLTANMETMMDNQKGMFNRMNRPWQWGVVVAGFMMMLSMAAMFGTMATLIITPIERSITHAEVLHAEDVERNLRLHMWFRETIAEMQVGDAQNETDIEWLMLMEERVNSRTHKDLP
jgi:hypothetical protein